MRSSVDEAATRGQERKEEILLRGNHLIEIQNVLNGTNEVIFQLNIRYTTHIVRAEICRTVSSIILFPFETGERDCKLCSSRNVKSIKN